MLINHLISCLLLDDRAGREPTFRLSRRWLWRECALAGLAGLAGLAALAGLAVSLGRPAKAAKNGVLVRSLELRPGGLVMGTDALIGSCDLYA